MAEAIEEDRQHLAASEGVGYRPLRPVLLHYSIARHGDTGLTLLRVPLEFGEEALAVFSSWESAQGFFLSDVFSGEWYARECSAGELVSFLCGPYERIRWVLFDPPSGNHLAESDAATSLIRSKRFVDHLLRGLTSVPS